MKRRGLMMLVVLGGIAPRPSAVAAAPTAAPAEIAYLIGAVESSHCDFERNGSWYDAEKAADHLRKKYQWLTRLNQFESAEEFIDKVASKSSFSGQPYILRCPGVAEQDSAQWLRESLNRYRQGATQSNAERQP